MLARDGVGGVFAAVAGAGEDVCEGGHGGTPLLQDHLFFCLNLYFPKFSFICFV